MNDIKAAIEMHSEISSRISQLMAAREKVEEIILAEFADLADGQKTKEFFDHSVTVKKPVTISIDYGKLAVIMAENSIPEKILPIKTKIVATWDKKAAPKMLAAHPDLQAIIAPAIKTTVGKISVKISKKGEEETHDE